MDRRSEDQMTFPDLMQDEDQRIITTMKEFLVEMEPYHDKSFVSGKKDVKYLPQQRAREIRETIQSCVPHCISEESAQLLAEAAFRLFLLTAPGHKQGCGRIPRTVWCNSKDIKPVCESGCRIGEINAPLRMLLEWAVDASNEHLRRAARDELIKKALLIGTKRGHNVARWLYKRAKSDREIRTFIYGDLLWGEVDKDWILTTR